MIADKTYEPVQPLRLAFLGLGTMGAPMAAHLLKAGHHVTVYNRTRAKADAWLAELGNPPHARVANTPRDAAYGADIVLSCVGNDKDLAEVATGPEGGFTEAEAKMARVCGLTLCSMGERILRCETAPVVAVSAIMYAAGEL